MAETNSYLNNLDTDKLERVLDETEDNVKYFEDTLSGVVTAYTDHLDNLMKSVYEDIIMVDSPSLDTIEKYFLELTNAIYFMGDKLENLGVKDDMSKAQYKEIYNNAYLNNQIKDAEKKNKTTVAENQAVAESTAIYESTVNSIYNRAYKIVKYKIDAASEMVKSLSKIITKRLSDSSLPERSPYDISEGGTYNG